MTLILTFTHFKLQFLLFPVVSECFLMTAVIPPEQQVALWAALTSTPIKFSLFKGTTNSYSLAFGGLGIHCSCGCETFYKLEIISRQTWWKCGDQSEHELNTFEAVPMVGGSFASEAIWLVGSDDDDLLQRFSFKQQHYPTWHTHTFRHHPDSWCLCFPRFQA